MSSWNIKSIAEWSDEEPGPVKPSPKFKTRCRYCGVSASYKKQGQWGLACSGCKGSLTRRLRGGKYGPPDDKATIEGLIRTRYDWRTGKWVEGLDRHWHEYDFYKPRPDGKPPLDPNYIHSENPPTAEELQRGKKALEMRQDSERLRG